MKLTNKHNLPESIIKAIMNDPYNAGPCDMSVTTLISPARKVELTRWHKDKITEDASDKIWTLFGQAMHHVLERADNESITEARLSIKRQGWEISGQLDRYDPTSGGSLSDYKVTSVYAVKNGHRKEWEAQLNILATLLREQSYSVDKLEIVAILRDWSNARSKGNDYPDCPVVTIPVPLWSQEKCEEYIDERIRIHQAAKSKLPLCTPEERWQTADVFALRKEGRKTAVKLYATEAEANEALVAAGAKHYIEHRPGKCVRCESYCPVAEFCEQWKNSQK